VLVASIIRAVYTALLMKTASTFETSVNFYQATLHNNPEASNFHTRRRETFKSHLLINSLLYRVFTNGLTVDNEQPACVN
jgi:hypothetical protein